MARLSVIIPVFNEVVHLPSFIESLVAAPCPIERELIFVDDGSNDGSDSILEEMSRRFPIPGQRRGGRYFLAKPSSTFRARS